MNTNCTPGPWQFEAVSTTEIHVFDCNGEDGLTGPIATVKHADPVTLEANAILIAAAPDLLAAMQSYILALDQWENSNKAERRVKTAEAVMRAAIAKANGDEA